MNKINFREKGVELKIACGVPAFACAILTRIFSLITGIDLWSDTRTLYTITMIFVIAVLIGYKLNKRYDPKDNYNKYFYIIFFVELCILSGLGFLT